MRKISATYIFPGNRPPLKNGILTCKNDGTILELTDTGGKLHEQSGLEQYSGMLVPGFVNSHCHLKLSHRTPSGKSSLSSVLPFLSQESPLFLAQNTPASKTDIRELKRRQETDNTFLVLSPNSNLYLENRLPQLSLFQEKKMTICLGTDTLTSNNNVSVLNEMITLQHYFPEITMQELVEWACLNGARAFRINDRFGSFEPGKKPGVNLITGADLMHLRLTDRSKVHVMHFRQQP